MRHQADTLLTHVDWDLKFQNQLGADIMKSKSEWKFEINIGVFALIVAARCDSQRGRCSPGGGLKAPDYLSSVPLQAISSLTTQSWSWGFQISSMFALV